MKYAGIGPDNTPEPILAQMQSLGMLLALRGFTLCSTRHTMADRNFEHGCNVVKGEKFIRIPTLWERAVTFVRPWMPDHVWKDFGETERGLVAAQGAVLLGDRFDTPVSFIVIWSDTGVGVMDFPVRFVSTFGIPMFNLAVPHAEAALWNWLNGHDR